MPQQPSWEGREGPGEAWEGVGWPWDGRGDGVGGYTLDRSLLDFLAGGGVGWPWDGRGMEWEWEGEGEGEGVAVAHAHLPQLRPCRGGHRQCRM
eukprot:1296544-Prymnesium_polylepis.1